MQQSVKLDFVLFSPEPAFASGWTVPERVLSCVSAFELQPLLAKL